MKMSKFTNPHVIPNLHDLPYFLLLNKKDISRKVTIQFFLVNYPFKFLFTNYLLQLVVNCCVTLSH